jgi:hypothetical protein
MDTLAKRRRNTFCDAIDFCIELFSPQQKIKNVIHLNTTRIRPGIESYI